MRPVFFYKPSLPTTPPDAGWRWWLRAWAPVVIAITVICIESTDALSSQHTSSLLRPILERWFGHINDSSWDLYHHYLRKTGHFVGYGTVGFTFLRAWLYTLDRRGLRPLLAWRLRSSLLAILSTAVIACGDEFHQAFIPSRSGSPLDVLLDTSGACMLCLLVWLLCWSRRVEPRIAPIA
jgi:VanZ family protein